MNNTAIHTPPEQPASAARAKKQAARLDFRPPPLVNPLPLVLCAIALLVGFLAVNPAYPTLKSIVYGLAGVCFSQTVARTRYERHFRAMMNIVLGGLILFVLATDLAKTRLLGAAVFLIFSGLAGLFGGLFVRKAKRRVLEKARESGLIKAEPNQKPGSA